MVNQEEIHRMAQSREWDERIKAVKQLQLNFAELPDKEQATKDLLALTKDQDIVVQIGAAYSLGFVFQHVTDKEQAWNDLLALTKDEDAIVQIYAVSSLGFVFQHVTDKEQAWKELLALTKNKGRGVQMYAISSLGSAFPHFTDKGQAWNYLLTLIKDEDSYVRSYTYHSLGRISILKATEAKEENFKNDLEKALEYFEKSANEAILYNPAKFCLPFYRSFYMITFRKEESEAEVKKSIKEAKEAVGESDNKQKLLEAIENLSNALAEVQKACSIGEIQGDLTAFSRYCNRAADLLGETEETAPSAVKLMRRGLPIIDENIKKILADIEEKSKDFCKDSKQTPFKNISRNAYQQIEGVKNVDSVIEAEIKLNALSSILRSISNTLLPEESNKVLSDQLDEMESAELCDKAKIIQSALISFHPQILNLHEKLADKDKWIEYLKDSITLRLDTINYGVFKIKHRSAEMKLALNQVQNELKKIDKIKNDLDNIGINLEELGESQNQNFQELNDGMKNICNIIENELLPKLPENDDKQTIIDKIDELKQSDTETLFNRVAGFSSIIGLILPLLL